MKNTAAIVVLLGLLSACAPPAPAPPPAPPPPPAPAPAPVVASPVDRFVRIGQATCDTFLGLSPEDRAAASMFYIGYEVNRFRAGVINVGLIHSIGSMAVNFCMAEPNRRVADAFAEAYLEARRW
jgi:HdeA/HdeB family